MKLQTPIKRTLSLSSRKNTSKQLLGGKRVALRTGLAKQGCTNFEFHDARRVKETGGCLKTLRELETPGHIELPQAQHKADIKPAFN